MYPSDLYLAGFGTAFIAYDMEVMKPVIVGVNHFFLVNFSLTELGMLRSTSRTLATNISITLSLFFS